MFTVHGAFSNPKTAREFIRFSAPKDYETRQEAEQVMKQWENEKRYKFIWIEGGK